MNIGFINGEITAIDGTETQGSPKGKIAYAMKVLAQMAPLPPNFTGYVDTEARTQHATMNGNGVGEAPAFLPDLGVNRWKYSHNHDTMRINSSGNYVLAVDYKKLMDEVAETKRVLKQTQEALTKALDGAKKDNQVIADLGSELTRFKARIMTALGWLNYRDADHLVNGVETTVSLLKSAREEADKYQQFKHALVTVLQLGWINPAMATADHLIERVVELVTMLKASEDKVLELSHMSAQHNLDHRTMLERLINPAWNDTHPGELGYLYSLLADTLAAGKEARERLERENTTEAARAPVMSTIYAGEMSHTDVFEYPPDAVELPAEPVGKAVFECTFEWARDNWDLFVDTFVHKTIHNPTETGGYIKVVTKS